jgi:MFS family permease
MENKKAGLPQALVIIATSILPMMAIVTLMPVIPAIVQQFKDMVNIMTIAPMVVSAPGLCIALFSPFAGYLTDRLGRRNLLLIFTVFYGFGGILPFFFHHFTALMGGRLLLGVGEAFILTIGNTLLGDYFSVKDRTKWLMWQGIIGSACGTFLLPFSGYLSTMGWYYPFLVYSFAFLITAATYLFIFEPARKVESIQAQASTISDSQFPLVAMLIMAAMTMVAAVLYFVYTLHFTLVLDSLGIKGQAVGNYTGIASIGVPIGAIFFNAISNKSIYFRFAAMFTLIGLGMIGIGLGANIPTVVASAFIQQLGCGMTIPTLIAWGLSSVPSEFRGRGMGFWTSGFFLGQFISPLVVSSVRSMIGGSWLTTFIVFGVVCLLMAAYNFLLRNKATLATTN